MRAEDVIGDSLTAPRGARLPRDSDIQATCPICDTTHTLAEAVFDESGPESVCVCANRCMVLLTIAAPELGSRTGRARRPKNYELRNWVPLYLPIYRGSEVVISVLLPPNAYAEDA